MAPADRPPFVPQIRLYQDWLSQQQGVSIWVNRHTAAGCLATVDGLGPEPGESRYSALNRFDGVSDYQGLVQPGPGCAGGLCDINGNLLNGPGTPLAGCSSRVAVTPQAMTGVAALDVNGRPQALLISVTVSCPALADTLVEGIRMRYAPQRT